MSGLQSHFLSPGVSENGSMPSCEKHFPPLEGWQAKPDRVVKRATQSLMSLPYRSALRQRARELRKAGMLHKVLLWQRLSKKQLHGLDFDRQKIIFRSLPRVLLMGVQHDRCHRPKKGFKVKVESILFGASCRVTAKSAASCHSRVGTYPVSRNGYLMERIIDF